MTPFAEWRCCTQRLSGLKLSCLFSAYDIDTMSRFYETGKQPSFKYEKSEGFNTSRQLTPSCNSINTFSTLIISEIRKPDVATSRGILHWAGHTRLYILSQASQWQRAKKQTKFWAHQKLLSILEIPFEKFLWEKGLIEGHWHIKYEE